MRTIKFRLWDKQEITMLYENMSMRYYIGVGSGELREHQSYGDLVESNLVTEEHEIMQYTGLRDRNNKEIYEGDICIVNLRFFDIKDCKAKVIFKDGSFWFQYGCDQIFTKSYSAWDKDGIEVIGNIYDNRDLFEF